MRPLFALPRRLLHPLPSKRATCAASPLCCEVGPASETRPATGVRSVRRPTPPPCQPTPVPVRDRRAAGPKQVGQQSAGGSGIVSGRTSWAAVFGLVRGLDGSSAWQAAFFRELEARETPPSAIVAFMMALQYARRHAPAATNEKPPARGP